MQPDYNLPTVTPIAGRRYKARNGYKTNPLIVNHRGTVFSDGTKDWDDKGLYFPSARHELDLIELLPELPEPYIKYMQEGDDHHLYPTENSTSLEFLKINSEQINKRVLKVQITPLEYV